MSKRFFAFLVLVVLLTGGSALANHKDPHGDPNTGTNARCDSWWRTDDYDKDGDHDTHDGPGTSTPTLVTVGGPDNTKIIAEGGHYVVYGDSMYVEVVGGQNYARPNNSAGSRGGYVQGEVDHAALPTDVDFLVATFAGAGSSGDLDYVEKDACVNVANTRVAAMDCTKPPQTGSASCN